MDRGGMLTNMSTTTPEHRETLVLDRKERIRRFGIDCAGPHGDGIVFLGGEWSVGGEYTQKLVVKNVSTKMRKLKYRLPSTQYFSLGFPERIDLSPGMHVQLDVVFRPVKMEVYDDTIYFKIAEHEDSGGFHVPVRALLSTLQVSIPPGLDFGLCPTNEIARFVFHITNEGEVDAPFEWSCAPPFRLEPMSGVVPVDGSVEMEATLIPTDATVFVSEARLDVGRGANAIIPEPILSLRLSAIGKYTHIMLSDERINFGNLIVGATEDTVKDLVIRNLSVVPATVKCERVESDREPVFEVTPRQMVVAPHGEAKLDIKYDPRTAGMFTLEHFKLLTPGGNAATLTVAAQADSPQVTLYKKEDPYAQGFGIPNSVNFRDVKVGEVSHKAIFLRNDSALPVRFQFITQESGTFRLSKYTGEIPAMLDLSVRIDFTPLTPTNFYQRVFVLVEHAMPRFFDVMGTGYIPARGEVKEQRPAPLRHAHVQAFRNRVAAGLELASPQELESLLEEEGGGGNLFALKGPRGTGLLTTSRVARPVTRSGESTRGDIAVALEFMKRPCDPSNAVFLSDTQFDFGYVPVAGGSGGERRTVTFTNNTRGKVTVQWALPGECAFEVLPSTVDVAAGQTADFRVTFAPSRSGRYYCQELEAYAYFKNQRTFRLVRDPLLQPPWCLKLKGAGHTFAGEHFAAQVSLSTHRGLLEFTGCHVGDSTFQTLRLTNHSNLPAQFDFSEDRQGIFEVQPRVGDIPPQSFQLVLARFTPKSPRRYEHSLRCLVNYDASQGHTVTLVGEGSLPGLRVLEVDTLRASMGLPSLAPNPPLFFKPTCLGLSSTRTVTLHNPVRIPVLYSIDVPASLSKVFAVSPRTGLLRGNQSTEIQLTFAPRKQKEYRFKFEVTVRALAGKAPNFLDSRMIGEAEPAEAMESIEVSLVGPGTGSVVTFDPPRIDFGTLLVNTSVDRLLTLTNNSECDVQYSLHSLLLDEEQELEPVPSKGRTKLLLIDRPSGVLAARSKAKVKATFHPLKACPAALRVMIKVTAVDREGRVIPLAGDEAALLRVGDQERLARALGMEGLIDFENGGAVDMTELPLSAIFTGKASFPTVVVRDARSDGPLASSTAHLWETLSLTELNRSLCTPLTASEVRLNLESSPDRSSLPRYAFPFVPAPLGSPPAVVRLELCNPGLLTTSFEVHFPNEREIEVPRWADEGEPTLEQLRQSRIVDELRCFEVFPRSGTLAPGESAVLTLRYSYESLECGGDAGGHELPVLVQVGQGKQFYWTLRGTTLPAGGCRLVQPVAAVDPVHRLGTVAVGTRLDRCPVQTTELVNAGDAGLRYEVDLAGLLLPSTTTSTSTVAGGEHGFQCLYLENPVGEIPARSSRSLRWRFLPLEAKVYRYELSVSWTGVGGGAASVTERLGVHAEGYDPRQTNPYTEPLPSVDRGLLRPPRQLLEVPGQLAYLSTERLHLGRLPQRAVRHELVVLRRGPAAAGLAVDFEWDAGCELVRSGLVRLDPMRGRLTSAQSLTTVKVICEANVRPTIVRDQIALQCRLVAPNTASRRTLHSRLESKIAASSTINGDANRHHTSSGGRAVVSRESIVSRSTHTRNHHLRTASLPNGRTPRLPTAQPSGSAMVMMDRSTPAAAAAAAEPPSSSSELHLSLWFEVVDEDDLVGFYGESVASHFIPLPRVHIPDHPSDRTPQGFSNDPFSPRSLPSSSHHHHHEQQQQSSSQQQHEQQQQSSSHRKAEASVCGAVFSSLFREVLAGHEAGQELASLPEVASVPLYADMRQKTSLLLRLERAFAQFDVDSSGKLSYREIRLAFKKLRVKARSAVMKEYMRAMDVDMDGEVDLREFVTRCPAEVQLAIEEALDTQDRATVAATRADGRNEAANERERAAVAIQGHVRKNQARREVEYQKFLQTEEGREQHRAAVRMQGLQRSRQARQIAKERQEKRMLMKRQRALADPTFQHIMMDVMENTMANLMNEALREEFDLDMPVRQFKFANESHIDDEIKQ